MKSSFSIYTKGSQESDDYGKKLSSLLTEKGYKANDSRPDLVFVIGGDGTVLRAFKKYKSQIATCKFLVIHDGTLGYFADFEKENLENLCEQLQNNELREISRLLVEMQIRSKQNKTTTITALNEVRIESVESALITDVAITDIYLETFRGNGFCICTTSGSTAYNKSLGGAIIQNSIDVFELTEIASINHNKYHCLNSSLNGFATKEFRKFAQYYAFKRVFVVGCCTDICVKNFVDSYLDFIEENHLNTQIFVPQNAVATFDTPDYRAKLHHYNALKEMAKQGVNINLIGVKKIEERVM